MRCNKCNSEMPDGTKFCTQCGAILGSNINSIDEKLMKAYIGGPKADQIYNSVLTSKFNIFAFLFGVFYYVYRKMYLVAFLIFLGCYIIGSISDMSSTIINLLIGFLFYPSYKWDMTRKIDKIKSRYTSSNEYELLEKVKAKGGTSVVAAVVLSILFFILIVLTVLSYL